MIFVGKLNQNFYLEPRVATRDQMRRVWEYLNFSSPHRLSTQHRQVEGRQNFRKENWMNKVKENWSVIFLNSNVLFCLLSLAHSAQHLQHRVFLNYCFSGIYFLVGGYRSRFGSRWCISIEIFLHVEYLNLDYFRSRLRCFKRGTILNVESIVRCALRAQWLVWSGVLKILQTD